MKNLKNKDDLVNFNIIKLIVKNSLHLVWTPCIFKTQNQRMRKTVKDQLVTESTTPRISNLAKLKTIGY